MVAEKVAGGEGACVTPLVSSTINLCKDSMSSVWGTNFPVWKLFETLPHNKMQVDHQFLPKCTFHEIVCLCDKHTTKIRVSKT